MSVHKRSCIPSRVLIKAAGMLLCLVVVAFRIVVLCSSSFGVVGLCGVRDECAMLVVFLSSYCCMVLLDSVVGVNGTLGGVAAAGPTLLQYLSSRGRRGGKHCHALVRLLFRVLRMFLIRS